METQKDAQPKRPFHELVAEKLIEQLQAGTAPWQKPWEAGEPGSFMPMNPTTGKRYKGINAIHLMSQGRDDERWMTYKQATAAGAQVRRGEKGTPVQYWKFDEEQDKRDESGKVVRGADGQPIKEHVKLERPRVFFATVFNAEQIDGLPPRQPRPPQAWDASERAEGILKASGAKIQHGEHDRAFYRPSTDQIHLPDRAQFPSADRYYATAMHELGHWTGHSSRLDRDLVHPFGSEGYAKEELRAEIASMVLGDELGLGHDPGQHAAYVASWIKVLKDDPLEIFRAASDAEKVRDFVIGLEQKQMQEYTPAISQAPATPDIQISAHAAADLVRLDLMVLQTTVDRPRKLVEIGALADQHAGYSAALTTTAPAVAREAAGALAADERSNAAKDLDATYARSGVAHAAIKDNHDALAQIAPQRLTAGLVAGAVAADLKLLRAIDEPDGEVRHRALIEMGRTAAAVPSYRAELAAASPDVAAGADRAFGLQAEDERLGHASPRQRAPMTSDAANVQLMAVSRGATLAPQASPLQAPIGRALNDPSVTFDHYTSFAGASSGQTLGAAMIEQGMTTIGHVTGYGKDSLYDTAYVRLGKLFGDAFGTTNAALERKGLAQHIASTAETLLQSAAHQVSAAPSEAQMTPPTREHVVSFRAEASVDAENFFAELRDAGIHFSASKGEDPDSGGYELKTAASMLTLQAVMRVVPDSHVMLETLRPVPLVDNSLERDYLVDRTRLERAVTAMESLPEDWTGQLVIQPIAPAAQAPEQVGGAFQLLARDGAAQVGASAFVPLASFASRDEAEEIADQLRVTYALSLDDKYDRAAMLAKVEEDRVRRDPNSTDEDRSAAKEARKAAEASAFAAATDTERRETEQRDRDQARTDRERDAGLVNLPVENITAVPGNERAGQAPTRTVLDVPYREKNQAKELGAKWDRAGQTWYVPPGVDPAPFAKWTPGADKAAQGAPEPAPLPNPQPAADRGLQAASGGSAVASEPRAAPAAATTAREYLAVPYVDRVAAKAAGALWDKAASSWYVGPKGDAAALAKWKPENTGVEQAPAMSPQEEFADALRAMGLVTTDPKAKEQHPIMDGKRHRIAAEGDKPGEKAGFYVGHLDGHPAGYIKNNRTGKDLRWKSKGYVLDPAEKAKLQAEAATKLAAREAEQTATHEKTADRLARQMAAFVPVAATETTPYLAAKGVKTHAGVFTDAAGKDTIIPAIDASGKQWSTQYVKEDGTKRFAKDSRKEGCFHPVGGLAALDAAPVIIVAEGYATAATIAEAVGHATVAGFDSGNLPAVARAMRERYPDKPMLIAGDDDLAVKLKDGVNPGAEKAAEAAKAVGAKVITPIFGAGEQQGDPKRFSDFNDLATKSTLGAEAVARQIGAAIKSLQVDREDDRKLVRDRQQEQQPKQRRAARMS